VASPSRGCGSFAMFLLASIRAVRCETKEITHILGWSLEKLEGHVKQSNRILNDLRTLRRLLFEERTWALSDNNGVTGKEEWSLRGVATEAA
jgi:hypothetical protein